MGTIAQSISKMGRGLFGRPTENISEPSQSNENKSRVSMILNSGKMPRIDVYHRPTFNRAFAVDETHGEESADSEIFTEIVCNNFRVAGAKKKFGYRTYDFDIWMEDEKKTYDAKFAYKPINDEVADMLFFAAPGVKADAEELEGNFLEEEFDITYEKLPEFLPDVIKEAAAEEEEEIFEITELEIVEETENKEEEVEVLNLEAPQIAGLLEEPAVEEPVEEIRIAEKTTFSIGFGTAAAANVGETVFSFGFGVDEPEDEPEISTVSVIVDNGVFASANNDEGHAVTL